jgi:hypothetical protein
MMRDGSFKEAQELEEGTSLMPLYLRGRKIDGRPGYIEVKNNKTNRFNSVHRLIYAQHAEVTLCKDDVIHHINFNPEDNTPENLQLTDRAEHQKIHDNLGKWMRDNLKDNTYEECFGKERAEEIKLKQSVSHKKSGPNAGTFKKGAVPHNKGKTLEEQYGLEKATELKEKISRKTKEAMRALEVREKYLATHHNHKVVKIEQLNIEEDVYDMTVDNYHNFAINSGVFVHNCNIGIFYGGMKALAFSVSRGGDFIDYHVSLDTGVSPAKAQYIKEDGNFDLSNPKLSVESGVAKIKESTLTREQNAIKTYYGVLIRYLLANIAKQFKNAKDMPAFPNPVPLVIGGGTAMVKGFIDLFKNEFEQKGFPINLSGIKIVDEPFTAVSRGCYADSALEEEE